MSVGANLLDAFPHPTIRTFEEKPNYFNLFWFREQLIENASSVPSTLGGCLHVHYGLILPDATYFWDT